MCIQTVNGEGNERHETERRCLCVDRGYIRHRAQLRLFLSCFPRDPFSIQYRCIRNTRLSILLSPLRERSTPAFSHRYRCYLKPRRVSSAEKERERNAAGIEMRMIVSYVQKQYEARPARVREDLGESAGFVVIVSCACQVLRRVPQGTSYYAFIT